MNTRGDKGFVALFLKSILPILMLLSLLSNRLYIDVGFSLSFAYFFSFVSYFILFLRFKFNIYFPKPYLLINLLVFFYLLCSLSVFYTVSVEHTFRFFLGSLAFFFLFFALVFYFINFKVDLLKCLLNVGVTYVFITFFAYVLGVVNFNPLLEHSFIFGVFVEKSIPRLVGVTIDPNFACLTLVFFLFLFIDQSNGFFRFFFTSLSFVLILLTLSRSGFLCLISSLLVYLLLKNKIKILLWAFALCVIFILLTFVIYNYNLFDLNLIIDKRVNGIQSASGRFNLWQNAYLMFLNNPLSGSGAFTFRYINILVNDDTRYAHNTYIEILVELGVLGLSLYLLLLLSIFIFLFRTHSLVKPLAVTSFFSVVFMSTTLSMYLNTIFIFFVLISILFYNFRVCRFRG